MALKEELREQGDFLFAHRSYLPLALVVLGLMLEVHQERFDLAGRESLVAEVLEGASLAVGLLGLSIRVLTVGHTPHKTSGRNTAEGQVAEVLNTTGAYSLVRNPPYLGNYLMWAAVAMATGSLWFLGLFSLVFWVYYERIVFAEEEFLRERFGARYLEWAESTPAFLPRAVSYRRPEVPFSWRKVARNEKNGLLGLLALLSLIGVAGDAAAGELTLAEESASLAAAAAALMVYLTIKAATRWSAALDESGR